MKRVTASVLLLFLLLAGLVSACGEGAWQYRPIEDVNDLEGRRVGVNLSWEADYALTGRDDLTLMRYDSLADMILALRFNKVDALAVDDLIWKLMQSGSEGLHRVEPAFGSSGYTLYFSPGNEALKDDFNAFLAEYRQSEAYKDHMARLDAFDGASYVGPDIPLTGTGETLRVAIDVEGYPRAFLEAGSDIPTGFDMEALKLFANDRNYRLQFEVSNYEDIIFGLKSGIYDIGGGYLSDAYEKDVRENGLYTSYALDSIGMYFVEKTQRDVLVNVDNLE